MTLKHCPICGKTWDASPETAIDLRSGYVETQVCPVCNQAKASENRVPPLKMEFVEKQKRLLLVWNPIDLDREHISTLCDGLVSQGFWCMAFPSYAADSPDIRIFNLDGAPAPDSGLIQQLLAEIVNQKKELAKSESVV